MRLFQSFGKGSNPLVRSSKMKRKIYTAPILINGEKFYPQSINLSGNKAVIDFYNLSSFSHKEIYVQTGMGSFKTSNYKLSKFKHLDLDLIRLECDAEIDEVNKIDLDYSIITVENNQLIDIKENLGNLVISERL